MKKSCIEDIDIFVRDFVYHKSIRDISLFFFPIIASEHFYVICINIKLKRFDIVDNSIRDEHYKEMPLLKYNNVPEKLVRIITYLHIFFPMYV